MTTTPALILADLERRLGALERTRGALAAAGAYLPLTGGTLTGGLTGTSGTFLSLDVGGTAVSLDGHTHSYAATSHTHDYAATSHTHDYAATSHTHSYAATSHTHDYLPLTGGTLTGALTINSGSVLLNGAGAGVRFEGTVANAYELTLVGPALTADRTVTLPNASGTVSLDGHTHSYAATSHTHSYLSTSGGTISGSLVVTSTVDANEYYGDNGSASDPSFTFMDDQDTGLYRYTTNALGVCTGGGLAFYVGSDRHIYHQYQLLLPNAATTTSYNTLRWNTSNGHVMVYSSLGEIKTDVVGITPLLASLNERSYLYDLRPVLFHEKDQADGSNTTRGEYVSGFIADEVLEVAPELAYYDKNGQLMSYGIEALTPHIIAELQRLAPMVEQLYATAHPDYVPPIPRPPERAAAERSLYEAAAAEQAAAYVDPFAPTEGEP